MAGYVDDLIASDLTVPARALLKSADARSESFPIDMMEGILEYLRAQLEPAGSQAGSSPLTMSDRADAQKLQLREQKIRERLVGLRERVRTEPAAVKVELTMLQTELDNLQLETVATANIAAVNGMWSALYDHLSKWGVITGKNSEYSTAMRRLNGWHTTLGCGSKSPTSTPAVSAFRGRRPHSPPRTRTDLHRAVIGP